MNKEYSDEEVVEIVKAFKLYMKKIVKHSAIDFVRMSKSVSYREIVYSDLVDEKVSLSKFDDDAFFSFEETNLNEVMGNLKINIKLTKREKEYLELILQDYSDSEIRKKMNITENYLYFIKYEIRKKIERNRYGK